jgi:drug/metabolite transporter (DMT)-like permease
MKRVHLALLIIMNLFWAGTYSAFKRLGETLSAGEVTTLRYTLATVLIGLLWPLLPGLAPRRHDLLKAAVMGVLVFSVGPRLQVLGVHLGKAGDASILIALEPLVTAVAVAEPLHWGQLWGSAAIVLGLVVGLKLQRAA